MQNPKRKSPRIMLAEGGEVDQQQVSKAQRYEGRVSLYREISAMVEAEDKKEKQKRLEARKREEERQNKEMERLIKGEYGQNGRRIWGRSGDGFRYCPAGVKAMNKRLWRRYLKEIHRTRGYMVTCFPGACVNATIVPLNLDFEKEEDAPKDKKRKADIRMMCEKCIAEFNQNHPQEPAYKLEKIKYATRGRLFNYYLTFEAAQLGDDSTIETFQAQYVCVFYEPSRNKVLLCERKSVLDAQYRKDKAAGVRCQLPCCGPP
ncbi:OLC1v1001508C1 [Oldenlandia corymbosa var. corymbosa]|uniref:OLC1v1001508C1 n=1 Tax=Oldenlandia corymbosa var. corymbosa TaxID=529605 RepID=A0AAV1D5B6_OLDCO|nr:OLC1v1001508C1 [Oldenlandia corymbosa var. corymbosa]